MNFSLSDLPDKYAAKIQEIAARKGISEDEVVNEMMRTFLDLTDNAAGEDLSCIARRLHNIVREKFGTGLD